MKTYQVGEAMWDAIETLEVAARRTREIHEHFGLSRDMAPAWAHGENWPVVTACYNGLEQALKVLLCLEHGVEVKTGRKVLWPKAQNAHDLAWLWTRLAPETRAELDDWSIAWRSLHHYAEQATAGEMLDHISQGRGGAGGLVDWRYVLIEKNDKLPRLCPAMMLSTWEAIVGIAAGRTAHHGESQSRFSARVRWARKLEEEAGHKVLRLAHEYRLRERGDGQDDLSEERVVREGVHRGPVTYVLGLIGSPGEDTGARNPTERHVAAQLLDGEEWQRWSEDWKTLLYRRRGLSNGGGKTIRWNSAEQWVETIPWELDQKRKRGDGPPQGECKAEGFREWIRREMETLAEEHHWRIEYGEVPVDVRVCGRDWYLTRRITVDNGGREEGWMLWEEYSDTHTVVASLHDASDPSRWSAVDVAMRRVGAEERYAENMATGN